MLLLLLFLQTYQKCRSAAEPVGNCEEKQEENKDDEQPGGHRGSNEHLVVVVEPVSPMREATTAIGQAGKSNHKSELWGKQ